MRFWNYVCRFWNSDFTFRHSDFSSFRFQSSDLSSFPFQCLLKSDGARRPSAKEVALWAPAMNSDALGGGALLAWGGGALGGAFGIQP